MSSVSWVRRRLRDVSVLNYEYAVYVLIRILIKIVFQLNKSEIKLFRRKIGMNILNDKRRKAVKRAFHIAAFLILPLTSVRYLYLFLQNSKLSKKQENPFFRTKIDTAEPSYIFFSPIDWAYRKQRPQNLAISLNRIGRDVFYINPTIMYHPKKNVELKIRKIDGISICTFYSNFSHNSYYIGVKQIPNDIASDFARLVEQMKAKFANFSTKIVIQQPGWWSVVQYLQGNQLIFDCMDLHKGFDSIVDKVDEIENQIDVLSDKIIVTSQYLYSLKEINFPNKTALVRNGVDFRHFQFSPQSTNQEQIVIGYFGAIAEWFDTDLVAALAQNNPTIRIEIIGLISDNRVLKSLSKYSNIVFLGEVSNSELPPLISEWRAGLIPFRLSPLILATNPVKMYEYAASGIPILATDIPEVKSISESVTGVYVASSIESFQKNLESALQLTPGTRNELRAWAQNHTWDYRAQELLKSIESNPKVSVLILMWNQGLLTLNCLKRVFERSDYNNLEVILIDNGSDLNESLIVTNWINDSNQGQTIYVRNEENLGFAAGNNVGLKLATGDFIVILNNDTEVTPGWIWRSLKHFSKNPRLGLLGPSTNNCGNKARVKLRNEDGNWLQEVIPRFGLREIRAIQTKNLGFFCVILSRAVLNEVGFICEDFGKGYFEDDDYCRQVEAAGYEISIARDIFVYHQMSASFDLLGDLAKAELFKANKEIYESKWGRWLPHTYILDEDQV